MTSTTHKTISEAVKADHREMGEAYDQYIRCAGKKDAQERWENQLRWEIARHSVGEEIVVYPLFEKHLGEQGHRMAEQDRADHQAIKEMLYNLESKQVGTAEHASLLKEIMEALHKHIQSEEQEDLPLLEDALKVEDSTSHAKSFARTKQFAPTRAHPSAPNKPPFETLAAFLAMPMDKLRDMFAKFPEEGQTSS